MQSHFDMLRYYVSGLELKCSSFGKYRLKVNHMAQSVRIDVDCFKDAFKRFKKLSVQELDDHVINLRDPKKFGQEVL